jgi:C-3',4' desaturase CrtD
MSKIIIVGTGMGSLSAAALLAKKGHELTILEQNYLPGGCSSSYYRQGFIFETGATTLVGFDKGMPLAYLFDEIGLEIDAERLKVPMKVHLKNGETLVRYNDFEQWISEAERVFGIKGQRGFWKFCFKISKFVWENSLKQKSFPPSNFSDLLSLASAFRPAQLSKIPWAFYSMDYLLKKFGLNDNKLFVDFVNEQLLITAQNFTKEVNVLFGATALCYTNFGNYYVYGGMIQMVKKITDWLESKKATIHYRTNVESVKFENNQYQVITNNGNFSADKILFGIPINNVLEIFPDDRLQKKYKKKILSNDKLYSAFQIGVAFKRPEGFEPESLHHQIHLKAPLPQIDAASVFLSYSHPIDWYRAPLDKMVASISCHIPNPKPDLDVDKNELAKIVLEELDARGLIPKEAIEYFHVSAAKAWERWTGRKFGFVGGYPQYMRTKPWQMIDARLDGKGAYICGDSAYPGQGIPGVALSGINAFHKMISDFGK